MTASEPRPEKHELWYAPLPEEPPALNGLLAEMAKQASLGHKRFCAGAHDHGEGELEYEWIEWADALKRLVASLESQLERLKADSLTAEEAKALLAVRCGFGDAAFVHPDTFASAHEKLRRLPHSEQPVSEARNVSPG